MQSERRIALPERISWLVERRFAFVTAGWMLMLGIVAGCQLGVSRFASCPLSYEEQKTALLKIAPVGMPREQAVKKLEEAGVHGDFGIRNSVYYCDVWEQESGDQWYLDLALLFDKSGRLYEIRPAQFLADAGSADVAQPASDSQRAFESPVSPQDDESSSENMSAPAEGSSSPTTVNPVRSGRRMPFPQDAFLPTM